MQEPFWKSDGISIIFFLIGFDRITMRKFGINSQSHDIDLTCNSKIYILELVIYICATKGIIDNLPNSSLLEAYYLCFTLGGAIYYSSLADVKKNASDIYLIHKGKDNLPEE